MNSIEEILEKLNKHTSINPTTGCWLWTGYIDSKGYGYIRYNSTMISVHRLSAHLSLNLDLTDFHQQACHKLDCTNKNCWNPDHLYLGNNSTNQMDLNIMGRKYVINQNVYKTQCPYGHEFTEENTYIHKNGSRRCKQCSKDRYAKRKLGI